MPDPHASIYQDDPDAQKLVRQIQKRQQRIPQTKHELKELLLLNLDSGVVHRAGSYVTKHESTGPAWCGWYISRMHWERLTVELVIAQPSRLLQPNPHPPLERAAIIEGILHYRAPDPMSWWWELDDRRLCRRCFKHGIVDTYTNRMAARALEVRNDLDAWETPR
jgi:hypothetical protein